MARGFERCIGGYAGCGNLGDDAILQGYLQRLSEAELHRVVVLSGRPRWDRRRFGVRCVGRKSLLRIVFTLMRSQRFLLGGGSLLQNGTGNLSLLYYLGLLRLARFCGCSTELLAAGIGPLHGKFATRTTARELKKCHFIYIRDANSASLLAEWGISPSKMAIVSDPALDLLPPAPTRRMFLLRELGVDPSTPYGCVILRPFDQASDACVYTIAEALRALARRDRHAIVFLLLDPIRDGSITSCVCRSVGGSIARVRDSSDALSIISGARLVVSMRLHGLIFAHSLGVPSLAISPASDEPKLSAFCAAHGIPHLLPDDLSAEAITNTIRT